jgi:iron complex outermembrane recepter protein
MLQYKDPGKVLKGIRFKRSLLAMSIMALSTPSFSQVANEGEGLEEIVVLGMKTSLENAQDIKREAATVKDVITASDIGCGRPWGRCARPGQGQKRI